MVCGLMGVGVGSVRFLRCCWVGWIYLIIFKNGR